MSKKKRSLSKIRKSAKLQECQVRIPGICNFDETTTILPGEYLSLLIPMGEDDVDYDVMAVDEYNDTYSFSYTISQDYGLEQEVAIEMSDID